MKKLKIYLAIPGSMKYEVYIPDKDPTFLQSLINNIHECIQNKGMCCINIIDGSESPGITEIKEIYLWGIGLESVYLIVE